MTKQIALPPRRRWRAAIAMVAAPIAAAFAIELLLFLIIAAISNGGGMPPFATVVGTWLMFVGVLLSCTFLLGWPFHTVAFRRRWQAAPTYIVAGSASGAIVAILSFVVFVFVVERQYISVGYSVIGLLEGLSGSMLLFAIPGVLTAWIFWLIRRPDRDAVGMALNVFE